MLHFDLAEPLGPRIDRLRFESQYADEARMNLPRWLAADEEFESFEANVTSRTVRHDHADLNRQTPPSAKRNDGSTEAISRRQ